MLVPDSGLFRAAAPKGAATVRLPSGSVRPVELHWYEACGIGRRELKIKRYLAE